MEPGMVLVRELQKTKFRWLPALRAIRKFVELQEDKIRDALRRVSE